MCTVFSIITKWLLRPFDANLICSRSKTIIQFTTIENTPSSCVLGNTQKNGTIWETMHARLMATSDGPSSVARDLVIQVSATPHTCFSITLYSSCNLRCFLLHYASQHVRTAADAGVRTSSNAPLKLEWEGPQQRSRLPGERIQTGSNGEGPAGTPSHPPPSANSASPGQR